MNDTTWVVEGATVAEYRSTAFSAYVRFTTVQRLTATQVVCASGNRYRRDNLREVGSGRRELLPVDDRQVRNAVAENVLLRLGSKVDALCMDRKGSVDGVLATLDGIEALVKGARAAIDDPVTWKG